MSCYHPQLLEYVGQNSNGKNEYKFTGVQGNHMKPIERKDPRDVLIPCRKCIGCRLDYSRRWADRLMLELDHSKTALFLTLTFDNDHATPAMIDENNGHVYYTLVKRDLQLFNKRLREFFTGKQIRFYAAGEYGDSTLRPHFHGIYYGLSLDDFPDAVFKSLNKFGQPYYESKLLDNLWKNGFVTIANVSWQSCAYVARYNLKKLKQGYDDLALSRNCLPEFSLMSRRPGIGGYFPYDHPEFFQNPSDDIILNDEHGVRRVGSIKLPKFLFDKLNTDDPNDPFSILGIANPELYAIIKEQRKRSELDSFLFELSKTDLNEFDYLDLKEKERESKAKRLRRDL